MGRGARVGAGILLLLSTGGAGVACSTLDGLTSETAPIVEAGQDAPPLAPDSGACPTGFRDCDGDPTNGCETNVTDNPSHCGFCGNACPARANAYPVCVDGTCRAGCNSGFDSCDGSEVNGCELSVSADPLNCGACGRDCRGAPCSNGTCAPQTLVTNLSTPGAIVVPGAQMFFEAIETGTQRALFRAAATGSSPVSVTQMDVPTRLAADGTRVAWIGVSGFATCELPQCTNARKVTADGFAIADFSLVDQAHIFLAANEATGGAVMKVDRTTFVSDSSNFSGPLVTGVSSYVASIALSANGVLVGTLGSPQGNLTLIPSDSTVPSSVIATGTTTLASALLVGGDRAFWRTNASPAQLMGCALPACANPKVYGTPPSMTAVTVDASYVYWTEIGTEAGAYQDGRVLRCPLSGCVGAPTVLATGQHRPHGVALTTDHVYWTTRGNNQPGEGAVLRVPR